MADTSKYTIEKCLFVSVWVHEKETGKMYEGIRENFFLRFNKAAPSEANLKRRPGLTTCNNQLRSYLKENLSIIQMDSIKQQKRDHPYLQNVHSRNAQADKQMDMAANSTVRRK